MVKLLIPLLTSLALPTAVNAETWWLIVGGRWKENSPAQTELIKVPMTDEKECKNAGEKIMSDNGIHGTIFQHVRYTCLLGK